MNGTFMFGEDRFSEREDYFTTYRSIGGNRLLEKEVTNAILSCYEGMSRDYEDPEQHDKK